MWWPEHGSRARAYSRRRRTGRAANDVASAQRDLTDLPDPRRVPGLRGPGRPVMRSRSARDGSITRVILGATGSNRPGSQAFSPRMPAQHEYRIAVVGEAISVQADSTVLPGVSDIP